jgi:hypothetical protein
MPKGERVATRLYTNIMRPWWWGWDSAYSHGELLLHSSCMPYMLAQQGSFGNYAMARGAEAQFGPNVAPSVHAPTTGSQTLMSTTLLPLPLMIAGLPLLCALLILQLPLLLLLSGTATFLVISCFRSWANIGFLFSRYCDNNWSDLGLNRTIEHTSTHCSLWFGNCVFFRSIVVSALLS